MFIQLQGYFFKCLLQSVHEKGGGAVKRPKYDFHTWKIQGEELSFRKFWGGPVKKNHPEEGHGEGEAQFFRTH